MSVAIKFENISKQYRLGSVGTGTLSHDLNRWWSMNIRGKDDPYLKIGSVNDRGTKADSDYVWALRNIDFEVQQGEVLGIIGKNGAGKSTLLKILSRVTSPTTGEIKARGRIASLLEVGTGFHPEMTGRENIYMNGAIMGMSKAEIRRKMDQIVDFAGIERYIDTPVKRYSSGMTVRLGFAVAAHLEPEILVVDEVLAVGDAEFQKKAIGKMQDISKGEGRTVLFVSHNMGAVKSLCSRGILLENGHIEDSGAVSTIISSYLVKGTKNNAIWRRDKESKREIFFNSVNIINSTGRLTNIIATEEDFAVQIQLTSLRNIKNATVSIRFTDAEGVPIFTTSLHDCLDDIFEISSGTYEFEVNIINNILIPGKYSLIIACFISGVTLFDSIENYISITIEDLGIKKKDLDRIGLVTPKYKWGITKLVK
jgi:lipopolysaccharide transport system ATP-binding protein